MAVLDRVGVDRISRGLSGLLPVVPLLAEVVILFALEPKSTGGMGFYAAIATVIPTSRIAIAISGRLLAPRLHTGVELFRAGLGLYLIGDGAFHALSALYRGEGIAAEVTAATAGVAAAFATVLVAALVKEPTS